MPITCLTDKDRIERFCRRSPFLHLYALGDLDDRLWPHTTWPALTDGDEIRALALLYTGLSLPVVLALADEELPMLQSLLGAIVPLLPERFYAHLSPGLAEVLEGAWRVRSHGEHWKMALADPARLEAIDTSEVVPLSAADADELAAFYDDSYPGHHFEPGMLEVGPCCGVRGPAGLISAAAVHVYSRQYGVAAPGNIATRPAHRGKGWGKVVTAGLCKTLLETVEHVGLNVKADNEPAVRCYRALGFEAVVSYGEYTLERR